MKLDFNVGLMTLDSKPQLDSAGSEITLGKLLANELSTSRTGDAVKLMGWAIEMHNGRPIDLDKSDQSTLKAFIKESTNMFAILKAQLLDVFDAAEKKADAQNKKSEKAETKMNPE